MKTAHRLVETRKSELPENVILFDTETTQQRQPDGDIIQSLKLGWACYWRVSRDTEKWCYFSSVDEFWQFVLQYVKPKKKLYLISHNLSFDMLIADAYTRLIQAGFKCAGFYDEQAAHISQWSRGTEKITCISSTNYFKVTLDELGKTVGVLKGKVDFDTVSDLELIEYCKQDVQVLKAALKNWFDFHRSNDLGNFAYTIAGQSFQTYRHRFMPTPILIHDRQEAYWLERQAYSGGRTECFVMGKYESKIYVIDVHSMYPAVMLEGVYPVKLKAVMVNIEPDELHMLLETYAVVARVKVKTDIPCVPVKIKNKLIFPVGEFWTTLCTPELKMVIERHMLIEWEKVAVYEQDHIFQEYVAFFYGERLKAKAKKDEVYSLFYKLLLNSLYGKFGQRDTGWQTIGETKELNPKKWEEYDAVTGKRTAFRQFAGIVQESVTEEREAFDSFPAVAGHVCSYARVKLWKFIEAAGAENVLYCDTDSIFCTEEGYQRLVPYMHPTDLGTLGLETEAGHAEFFGPKDYQVGEKVKHKGIKKTATFEGEDLDGKPVFQQQVWKRTAGMIEEGNLSIHRIVTVQKHLKREYMKGWVLSTGVIAPFEMNSEQVVRWEDTTYYKSGAVLLNERQPQWVHKEFDLDAQEKAEAAMLREYDREHRQYDKEIRKTVIKCGGVKDDDYSRIPKWARRKKGYRLDILARDMNQYGYQFEDGDALYEVLRKL